MDLPSLRARAYAGSPDASLLLSLPLREVARSLYAVERVAPGPPCPSRVSSTPAAVRAATISIMDAQRLGFELDPAAVDRLAIMLGIST